MARQSVLVGNPNDLMKALERDALEISRRHFVFQHEEILINLTDNVDTILNELLEEELLSDVESRNIRSKGSSKEKMRQLYQLVLFWDSEDKDTFLEILKKHNRTLIEDLQGKDERSEGFSSFSSRSSPFSAPHKGEMDCDVCGRNHDPADIPIMPNIRGTTYRLELKCAGRFCCSETGIKFQVTRPVTIEYELDSWSKYMDNPQLRESEVLGPLFNIKTPVEPNIVSAVYLPHYLCLKKLSGDTSSIKCAHLKDGNLSVETPSKILPFHVVLENPSFSSLGVFFWNMLPNAMTMYLPIHGKVLLYFKKAGTQCVEYKIHLYLLPAFAPIDKDFLQEKTSNGFVKIDKPPRTKTIYTKKSYIVKGPENAHVQPTGLDVQCASPLESYTDITMDAAVKLIDLCLVQEDGKNQIWGCRMSRGEVEELHAQVPKSTKPKGVVVLHSGTKQQFVDKYREALITCVPLVDPILDSLLAEKLLTDEEYDNIRSKTTSQEKMRELYMNVRGWGLSHKAKLYDALEKHNAPLIQHLKEDF